MIRLHAKINSPHDNGRRFNEYLFLCFKFKLINLMFYRRKTLRYNVFNDVDKVSNHTD